MTKPACFLLFLLIAVPCFAQENHQQFGFLIGGSERLYSHTDKARANAFCAAQTPALPDGCVGLPASNYRLADRDFEAFYSIDLEPSTQFKIRAGQINTDVGGNFNKDPNKFEAPSHGKIEHVDGIIQYSVSEPFGRTALFAGFGIYRWSGAQIASETNYGYTGGVNADFPITRRYGVVLEGSYHWVNMSQPVRYVTFSGGLRVAF